MLGIIQMYAFMARLNQLWSFNDKKVSTLKGSKL